MDTDAEGDPITISSDEELLEALDQFDGTIFKIHLKSKCIKYLVFFINTHC